MDHEANHLRAGPRSFMVGRKASALELICHSFHHVAAGNGWHLKRMKYQQHRKATLPGPVSPFV
jgi:hypothetical protein